MAPRLWVLPSTKEASAYAQQTAKWSASWVKTPRYAWGAWKLGQLWLSLQDYIALVHACLFIATPFALLSSYSTPFEFKHALTLSKATRLFVNSKLLPVVIPVAKEVGFPLEKIYILEGHAKGRRTFSGMINEVRYKAISPVSVRPVKNDTLAYLVFSSGTSGLPKGTEILLIKSDSFDSHVAVMISHGNLSYSLAQMIVVQRCVAEVYTVTVSLVYHVIALITCLHRCFSLQCRKEKRDFRYR